MRWMGRGGVAKGWKVNARESRPIYIDEGGGAHITSAALVGMGDFMWIGTTVVRCGEVYENRRLNLLVAQNTQKYKHI